MLDERSRRRFAAAEALAAGRGGIAAVARATGIAPSTIGRALWEVRSGEAFDPSRLRRPGAGGKLKSETDPSLIDDLRALVEPDTRGDPQSPLLWTCKSLSKLAQALCGMGHQVGRTLVGELLHQLGYRLQANRKTREGTSHPDRDAQFHYINGQVKAALVVLDLLNLGKWWQEVSKRPALPLCRVVAAAVTHSRSPAEYKLDAPAEPAGRLRLLGPDRLQHLQHVFDRDGVDGLLADHRVGIHPKGALPLGDVLVVLPSGAVGLDVLLGTFCEGRSLGLSRWFRNRLGFPPLAHRIAAALN